MVNYIQSILAFYRDLYYEYDIINTYDRGVCMYEQKYIDSCDESILKNILDGGINYSLNITSSNPKEQQIYFVFQHYLIKQYLNGYNREKCREILKGMYNDFHKYPHLFYDSPLLKNETLNNIMGNASFKQMVIKFRDDYYNGKKANKLYMKKDTEVLTEQEKNQLYSNMQRLIYSDNPIHQKMVEREIERIIDSDYSSLNNSELSFYCQYISSISTKSKGYKTHVVIGEDKEGLKGYQLNDYIFINKKGFESIELMTETVFHETRHSIQYHESKHKKTRIAFDMAQQNLFCKYLNTMEYDSYHKNYKYSQIELDAEKNGHYGADLFFYTIGRKDLQEKIKENRIITTDTRNYYDFMLDIDKKPIPTDTYIVNYMNKIIKSNPNELNNYPVLLELYNKDGNLKSFSEIMNKRINIGFDERGLYDNYIDFGIKRGLLNEIDLSDANDNYIKKFNNTLQSIYRDNICQNLKAYFEDTENEYRGHKYNEKQVLNVTKYKLSLAYETLSYVNNNFELLLRPYKNERFSTSSELFNFIYDFRDFDINVIKNPIIKNNQEIVNKIAEFKKLTDEVIKKFNFAYVDSKLNTISPEIKNITINDPKLGEITFDDYCKYVIASQLDGHQKMIVNNEETYAGELIDIYVKNLTRTDNYEENNSKTR